MFRNIFDNLVNLIRLCKSIFLSTQIFFSFVIVVVLLYSWKFGVNSSITWSFQPVFLLVGNVLKGKA